MVDGQALTFDLFGLLQGVLTMRDRQTGTLWTHLDGKAIGGPLQGQRLQLVAMPQMTWQEWRTLHPETLVLSQDTPYKSRYRPVRIGMFNQQEAIYGDARLPSNALVIGVELEGQFRAYLLETLDQTGGVANDTLAGHPLLVVYNARAKSGVAYSRVLDGMTLDFVASALGEGVAQDTQTGSLWNIQGRAIAGPLAGKVLEYMPSFVSEWYGWSAYHPETGIYPAPL